MRTFWFFKVIILHGLPQKTHLFQPPTKMDFYVFIQKLYSFNFYIYLQLDDSYGFNIFMSERVFCFSLSIYIYIYIQVHLGTPYTVPLTDPLVYMQHHPVLNTKANQSKYLNYPKSFIFQHKFYNVFRYFYKKPAELILGIKEYKQ